MQGSDFCRIPAFMNILKSINCDDLFFVIRTAGLAYSMRHHKSTAFAAFYQVRSTHLPVCSSLISSSFGRFILWTNRHRSHLLYAFSSQFVIHRNCIKAARIIHTPCIIHITYMNVKQFFLFRPGTYFASLNVSLAIASSSFVGISITFTLESAVEITLLSPRTLLASSSMVTPR